MIMIISLHYLLQGGVLDTLVRGDNNYFPAWLIESVCYPAVNCYILISGYFLCGKTKVNCKRVIELIAQVVFYSVGIYLFFCLIGIENFSLSTLATGYLFPVTHGEYWFATVYIVSLFAVPYISKLIGVMDRKQYRNLLVVFGCIFSVIPSVIFFAGNSIGLDGGYSLIWFIYLYFFAGYIRKYNVSIPRKYLCVSFLFFSVVPFVIKVVQQQLFGQELWDFYHYNSISVFMSAASLFLLFLSFKERDIKIINLIGKSTFGVFLIHTQYIMRDTVLWEKLIRPIDFAYRTQFEFIAHFLISVALIFVIGSIIDNIRDLIFYMIKRIIKRKDGK